MAKNENQNKWLAFGVLCLGTVMEVLDTTIVNVALPSIRTDLQFSAAALAWVVNAYLLTFGGFLLLGGRLGDLFGPRRLFIIGIALFTAASLLCGLSTSQWMLITARAIQGVGGAIASAVGLSLVMNMFTKAEERARAMGYFGFIAAGGGSVGVLLGGLLTSLNWHLIFLINVPIGIIVVILSKMLLPVTKVETASRHLDALGAVTVTGSLLLAVYAIVNGNEAGWGSSQTLGILAVAAVLMFVFVKIESSVKAPLVPLSLFKMRNLTVANIIGVLWAAAMFAWFFMSALYLQLILKYTPLQVGLTFLPSNLIMGVFSLGLSAKIVMRFGIKKPLAFGLGLAGVGLLLFARAPVNGSIMDVLPGMILLGLGAGMAFNPVFLAAMNDVKPEDSGLASGVVNTAFMMGGSLGLAILASIAAFQTSSLLKTGVGQLEALNSGYQAAFLVGAFCAGLAAFLGASLLKTSDHFKAGSVGH